MSTINPILVRTNIRRSRPDDLPANESLLHCHATLDGDGTFLRDEPFTLTSKEQQAVHNTALNNRFSRELRNDEIHSRPSKDSLIIGPNDGDSFSEGLLQTSHEDIIVTLYDGPSEGLDALNKMDYGEVICTVSPASETDNEPKPQLEPKPSLRAYNSSKSNRSWLPPSPESPNARSRWFKVLHVKGAPADTDWSQVLETLYHNIDTTATGAEWVANVRLCRLPVTVSRNIVSTQQLEQCGNNPVRDSQISESTGIPLRSIKQLAGLHKRAIPESLHDVQGQGSFLGVDLISGLERSFRSDENENLYVVEKARTALVHSDKPYTLADVVSQRHQHQALLLHSREVVAMLNEEFQHVKVSVRVGKYSETRTIAGFREGNAAEAPLKLRHYAWSLRGETFGLPHLPCVNVGTLAEPLLLPLELCTVLPSQRLRGPIDASLSRIVEHHRVGIVSQTQSDSEITGRVVVPSPPLDNSGTLNEKVARACGNSFPNLLFVEASTSRVESPNWTALQDSIRELIKTSLEEHALQYAQSTDIVTQQKRLLNLQYRPDAELSDRWTEQLREFTTLHEASKGQRTFVVVYLPADNRSAEMYKIIKKACDTTVGVQTFFVNHANVEARVCGSPTEGVFRVAAELRRRICLRKPPRILMAATSRKTPTGPKRLIISMHIAPVTFPAKSRIASGHVTELYIVALVSLDLETGSHAHTEIKLYSADQVKQLDMRQLFAPFIDFLPSAGRYNLTILRSGHFPEREITIDTTNESSEPATPRTRPYTAEVEFADIRKTFSEIVTPAECKYITLKEDKALRLHVDTTGLTMPALVVVKSTRMMDRDDRSFRATHVLSETNSTGVIAMTVLPGPASASTPNIRAKSQTPSRGPSPTKKRSPNKLGESPARPFTTFNSAGRANKQHASPRSIAPPLLTVETPSKISVLPRGDAASRFESRIPSSTQIPLPPELNDPDEEASTITHQLGELTVEPTEPAINETDAQALGELWDGQELELFGTKWPIVTHLAHLAVKRALLHLDSNDWDGTKAKGKATAPFFLPPVNDKVRNSLYYL